MKTETANYGRTNLLMPVQGDKVFRVLIVDDDKIINDLLHDVIEIGGFEAESILEPEEALDYLIGENGRFDMVITDYEMPNMSGPEFIRIAKNIFPHIFIAGMSGHAGVRDDFIGAGADTFFQKPFRSKDILNLITLISQKNCGSVR